MCNDALYTYIKNVQAAVIHNLIQILVIYIDQLQKQNVSKEHFVFFFLIEIHHKNSSCFSVDVKKRRIS